MSKGGKTKTTTVNQIPEWMSKAGQQTYTDARNYMQANPVTPYTGQLTAPVSEATNAASAQAMKNASAGQGQIKSGERMIAKATGGATPKVAVGSFDSTQADRYMTPFLRSVQERTIGEMQRQNEIDRDALGDEAQGVRAYGGLRHAVEAAEQGRAQNDNILDYLARSNQAAYESAQGQFERDRSAKYGADTFNAGMTQADRDRQLAAAGVYKDLAGAASGVNSDSIRNMLLAGQGQFEQGTAANQAAYEEYLRQQNEPWNRYTDLMGMLSGAPYSTTSTNTQKQSQGWLNTALAVGGTAASVFFSDPRLKTNVVKVAEEPDGLAIYEFDYIDHPILIDVPKSRYVGVMAPDVERLRPWALGPRVHGFQTVNYHKIEEAH